MTGHRHTAAWLLLSALAQAPVPCLATPPCCCCAKAIGEAF